jgi:hypothetical protein
MGRVCNTCGEKISAFRFLVGERRKESLRRPRYKWEDNIKTVSEKYI